MDQEILEKFAEQNRKLDAIYQSSEKTRKYFLWSAIFNIVIFVLPLIGLVLIIPWFLSSMDYGSLGL